MLNQLLRILEQNQGQIDLKVVSRQLGCQLGLQVGPEPSAVAGMLETLIAKGRIEEVGLDCGICSDCSLQSQCDLPIRRTRRFRVVGRPTDSSISQEQPKPVSTV